MTDSSPEPCWACEGEGYLTHDVFSNPTFFEMLFGGYVPRRIGTVRENNPCPRCDGSGQDPDSLKHTGDTK